MTLNCDKVHLSQWTKITKNIAASTSRDGCTKSQGRQISWSFFCWRRTRIEISSSCKRWENVNIVFHLICTIGDLKMQAVMIAPMLLLWTYCFGSVCSLLSLCVLTAMVESLKVRQSTFHCLVIIVCLVFIRQFLYKQTKGETTCVTFL